MTVNASLIKTLGRWAFATFTSAVTTFLGLYGDPFAFGQEADCSLQDVSAWQRLLDYPIEEATPAYVYRVTTDFIDQCPNRPEIRQAQTIAAMAAVSDDDADRALRHFEEALPLQTLKSQFYYIAALLADKNSREAWDVRDQVVADWAAKLKRHRSVTLDETRVRGGTVYRVMYNALDPETRNRVDFVADQNGEGWPATITLGSDRQLNAFHRLRAGQDAQPLRHIDLHRCTGRKMLARADASASLTQVTETAETSLMAYLANPDIAYGKDGEIIPCLWPGRLLPGPPR